VFKERILAVLQICCKFEVKFLRTMSIIDLPTWNFLLNNFLRLMILQKNRHTAARNICCFNSKKHKMGQHYLKSKDTIVR